MTRGELEDKIIDIVRLQLNLDIPDINLNSTFEELNMDALDYIEIEMVIEKELKIIIPNQMPKVFNLFVIGDETIDIVDIKGLVDNVEFILNDGKQF